MPMPIAAAGTQWRIRVIAAWPIASTADTDGLQAQSIARESLTKTCVVTACLDPRSMHSYISRDLALFVLGPEGLRLAEAAAHKSILGQVGLSMANEEEEMTGQWTESFLLGDKCDLDLVMSPWTWNSLRQQEASCLGRWIHKSLSCSFLDDGRSIPGEHSSSYTTLLAQDEEDLYPTQPSEPSSTPLSCRSPTLSQARLRASDKSHTCNLPNSCNSGFSVDSPRQVERKDLGEVAPRHCAEVAREKVWAWDAQEQNYFARNRSKDDSWYWYPREIV
ncbi:hypothetical protein LIA77_01886 [Sarocladium implicatum]|nr:hypothetical protein LIA77_01886 [Sarocladium implicatum]